MSHTVTCEIEIRDPEAFRAAALALGAELLGEGAHQLFEHGRKAEHGFGIKFPGWLYPVVLTPAGLRFDDFGGRWGNPADITRLTERYAIEAARNAATAQGWMSEETTEGLLIYHPDGGTITVTSKGGVDAACFEGRDCASATAPIEAAIGRVTESTAKPEMLHKRARLGVASA